MKKSVAATISLLTGILAIVAAIVYRFVMYTDINVYYILGGVAAVAVLNFLISNVLPRVSSYLPILAAAGMAFAAVWGSQLMVNQIGYVYAGLDSISTIMTWIVYLVITLIGMLFGIVASFMPPAQKA